MVCAKLWPGWKLKIEIRTKGTFTQFQLWAHTHLREIRPGASLIMIQPVELIHKSQNAPVPYPIMFHSEQKCAHFCSEWSIVGYGTGALWDLWDWSIFFNILTMDNQYLNCEGDLQMLSPIQVSLNWNSFQIPTVASCDISNRYNQQSF